MINLIDTDEWKEDIISLWNECFGDSRAYIEYFLENCPNICIGYHEYGHLLSMLFLLDGKIDSFRIKYIYAACTTEKFRGRGLMSRLIDYSENYCREINYDGIFLVPGEESLYDYYSRFGFKEAFLRNDYELKCDITFSDFSETEDIGFVTELRNSLLESVDSFAFDRKTAEYSVKEHINNGGKVYFCDTDKLKCLLFVIKENDNFVIKELLCSDYVEMLKNIEQFTNNNTENVYIRNPIVYNSKDIVVKCTKCGMIHFVTDEFRNLSVGRFFYAGIYLD